MFPACYWLEVSGYSMPTLRHLHHWDKLKLSLVSSRFHHNLGKKIQNKKTKTPHQKRPQNTTNKLPKEKQLIDSWGTKGSNWVVLESSAVTGDRGRVRKRASVPNANSDLRWARMLLFLPRHFSYSHEICTPKYSSSSAKC